MTTELEQIKQNFVEGLSQISRFWGFPRGMGAIFGVLYLSPAPLSLAISTEVRSLARIGLVHRSTKLGDRKDYYEAEADFYAAIRSILKERQNSEFDRAVRSVRDTLNVLEANSKSKDANWQFTLERVRALQEFFNAIDSLNNAVIKLEKLGFVNVQKILGALK
jgi:DNA-binding transcriptional regulator GbsR (MarR family)